jgi:hypothetical protein
VGKGQRFILLGVAGVLLLSAALVSASAATAPLKPLLKTRYQASQLVGDSGHIAWEEHCGIRIYSLATRKRSSVPACRNEVPQDLVLARDRAYWSEWNGGNAEESWTIFSVARGHTREVDGSALECGTFDDTGECTCYNGPSLAESAGGGSTFVYDVDTYQCPAGVVSTDYYRVVFRNGSLHKSHIPNVPSSSLLHYGGGRIGILDLAGSIEIRNPATGNLVRTITTGGVVFDFAFSRTTLAALVFAGSQTYLAGYSLGTGHLLGSIPVPESIWSLGVSGSRILYQVGRHVIRVLNAANGNRLLAVRLRKTIWGSVIVGRRVVWFTNQGSHGSRIYAARVP